MINHPFLLVLITSGFNNFVAQLHLVYFTTPLLLPLSLRYLQHAVILIL